MPIVLKVLVVEDSKDDLYLYKSAIKNVNFELAGEYLIEPVFKENKADGLAALQSLKDELDGALIDLKLTHGAPVDLNEGNDIVGKIYGKLRFPIAVLTNTPGGFNNDFKQSVFLKLYTKVDVEYEAVLKSIIDIHRSGITNILGKRGLIENFLDSIFWQNISIGFEEWLEKPNTEKPLLRYILTHLQEYLEISDDLAEFETFHSIENYIQPSIKSYFFTGDIIHLKADKSKRYIILTPACDLAPHNGNPKSKDVLLAEIQTLEDGIFRQKVNISKKAATTEAVELQIRAAKDDLRRIITNNFSPKYYYLPDTKLINGGLINFQKLLTVPLNKKDDYDKEATVTTQFVKDIIAKFSFYYSRQGSPDFDFENLLEKHLN